MEIFGGRVWIDTVDELQRQSRPAPVNDTNVTTGNLTDLEAGTGSSENVLNVYVIVPLYVIIFILSITGNLLVLITLGKKNKVKYSVTNAYLINLAAADLLLGVFCMPFTLIGQVLQNFIFGHFLCSVIPYFQAISVSVGVWTLVAISFERYFAICRPLEARRWQTPSHAYKTIAMIWVISCLWTSPIYVFSRLRPYSIGKFKCREIWPNDVSEKVFNIFLDIILLLIPLTVMGLTYCLIVGKLWRGLQNEVELSRAECAGVYEGMIIDPERQGPPRRSTLRIFLNLIGLVRDEPASSSDIALQVLSSSPRSGEAIPSTARRYEYPKYALRSNYMEKSIEAKRKVIRMLFVVVTEFFLCWAPLHVLNTWYLFAPDEVHRHIGPNGISLVQLLAYISSCCNPITYCFMNKKFRQSFFSVFTCCLSCARTCGVEEIEQRPQNVRVRNTSGMTGNETAIVVVERVAEHDQSEDDIDIFEGEDFEGEDLV